MIMPDIIEIKKTDILDAHDIAQTEKICFAVPWSEKSIHEFLENEFSVSFSAVCGNNIIGYIGMYVLQSEGEIANIAVNPEYRRRGIASMLIEHIIRYCSKNNISKLKLEVRESNAPALKLYEKFGFFQVGTRKNYYIKPKENAVLMDKNISAVSENI